MEAATKDDGVTMTNLERAQAWLKTCCSEGQCSCLPADDKVATLLDEAEKRGAEKERAKFHVADTMLAFDLEGIADQVRKQFFNAISRAATLSAWMLKRLREVVNHPRGEYEEGGT